MTLLLDLPNELLFQITHYLTHNEIFHFLRANRRLAELLRTAQFDCLRNFRSLAHGRKALFHAAAREDTTTVTELVRIGTHYFAGGKRPFLNHAIGTPCAPEVIKVFLRCGIEADSTDLRGRTPLAIAARAGRVDVVEILLKEEGVRVNMRCRKGNTPFMFAALAGRIDVMRLLLEDERVDVSAQNPTPSVNPVAHSTLLHRVVAQGLYNVTELLLQSPKIDHETELLGSNSCTVLYKAVEMGHRRLIKLLLNDGRSDPNFLSSGQTPLHCAVREGRLEAMRLLLADPRIDVSRVSSLGITPMHIAARLGQKPNILKALLEDGRADVNARNPRGETPLFIAVTLRTRACVELLLAVEGIDLSTANNNGLTLMAAARAISPAVDRAIITMLKQSIDKKNESIKAAEARLAEEELEKQKADSPEPQARDLQASAVSSELQVQVQEVGSKIRRKQISRFRLRFTWLTRLFVRRRKTNT